MPRGRPRARSASPARRTFKEIKVGRFDDELRSIVVDNGASVGQVLDKAGITLSDGEEVNSPSGLALSMNESVKDGAKLIIVGNHKSA
ncbi:unnamed protein product [marine sediment metagenome]|uniref:Uncharacterized protein n=1 Tax=marine sediment metagenome TaxID=412755 RepID=X1L961_9ZZZZ